MKVRSAKRDNRVSQIRNIKATVFAPETVAVEEAYQAFLSILETNGLTVVPHGRYFEIVATLNSAAEPAPTVVPGVSATDEDRYITQMDRLRHVSVEAQDRRRKRNDVRVEHRSSRTNGGKRHRT